MWCTMVQLAESRMSRPRGKRAPVRLSFGLDPASHAKLSRLANRHDVSLAWMIRKAIADFIEQQDEDDQAELPLWRGGGSEHSRSA